MQKKENLMPNGQRAKMAIIFIWIVLALEIVKLISNYMMYDLLQTSANGGIISDETVNSSIMRVGWIAIFYLIAFVISGIRFIMWFRRAYFNLHQKFSKLKNSAGWAVAGWFVPIFSLFIPYEIMKEIYVKTKELFTEKGLADKVEYSTSYLKWWWTLWLTSGFVAMIVILADSLVWQMILGLLMIPLALITIKIIRDYSKVESLLAEIIDEEEMSKKE